MCGPKQHGSFRNEKSAFREMSESKSIPHLSFSHELPTWPLEMPDSDEIEHKTYFLAQFAEITLQQSTKLQ